MRRLGILSFLFLFPSLAYAALININTADATLLDTLPGIGPTYATRIVDYRTAHGPFAQVSDIQNVSGIGPSTYANLKDLITVGVVPDPVASSTPVVASSTSTGGASTYVPPPSALTLTVTGDHTALIEAPLHLIGRVTGKNGIVDSSALLTWSFGDGSSMVGNEVDKVYRYAGTYVITVVANNGIAKTRDEITISVIPAKVRITGISNEGVTIVNDSRERLDLGGWRLASDTGSFRFPEGTIVLPETSVLFPSSVTNLSVSLDATLLYPNGIVAARFVPVQPVVAKESSISVQPVETIIKEKPVQVYAHKAVIAPAVAPNTGDTAGAVYPPLAAAVTAPEASKTPTEGFFHSVWTLGLLGVMTLAGGAFILL